ncbi:Opsin-5 [Merluccius polli]|uniref:Opsin-5 n=1 Tax=Merluccius polli TaxID=89951 RepID=A0AA47N116_MERPO|nr:Opsin-5 [Merluccius polli]
MQGFVFGISSLLATCLISLDRCLKICCLQYGQWIERRHVFISIGLVWLYTLFWASLPVFGFGSYGPEPYGTSCTIDWWRMRSCLSDRVYIFLILMLCFGFPTVVIIISYTTILVTVSHDKKRCAFQRCAHMSVVHRSNRTLASIPLSSVSHASSKDLRLTKMAAVICTSFLVAWTPYATASLYSALVLGVDERPGPWGHPQAELSSVGSGAGCSVVPGISSLFNQTWVRCGGDSFGESWSNASHLVASSTSDLSPPAAAAAAAATVTAAVSSALGETEVEDPQLFVPCMSPMVSLIPVMLAKSHCMFNPFIYQIMNPEFRRDACNMLLCRAHRRGCRREGGSRESEQHSTFYFVPLEHWGRRSNPLYGVELEGQQRERGRRELSRGSWSDHSVSVGRKDLKLGSLDTD